MIRISGSFPDHARLGGRRRAERRAGDLTQAFFTRAMEKDFFDGYDRQKGRFRTFLRTCLDRFLSNEDKSERRLSTATVTWFIWWRPTWSCARSW